MSQDHVAYCADQVRRFDNDRFAAALFAADATARMDLMVLYAFNLEIARVAEVVSEPIIGQIRLQWWRDALDGLYAGSPREHAVALPLADVVARRQLPRPGLERLIDARMGDLEDQPPADLAALEDYADGSSGQLNQLGLSAVGGGKGNDNPDVVRRIGIAWALIGVVRGFPFHARTGRRHLPDDLCRAEGLDASEPEHIREGEPLFRVCAAIVERAREHLAEARRYQGPHGKQAHPLLLMARLADLHVARLKAARMNPFDQGLGRPLATRHLVLAWAALSRRF